MGMISSQKSSSSGRIFAAQPVLTVSAAQTTALARILASRYRRLSAGELYRIDGWPLPEPTEAITVDTALIFIGLSQCLGDHGEAETALRDIVVLFLRSLHLTDEARRSVKPNKLDLRHQWEMLRIWMKHRERSPMAAVLGFAAFLLFGNQIEGDGERGPTSRQLAGALFADAWALYSKTLNLFGQIESTAPKSSIRAA
ncbi:MAG TPA: hypothetical protein VFR68_12800 [Candidatus Dormibacteraeota bacterium]|nr:hypothetical protein [Candidatus Dormibacteraeota bacterium]